MKNGEVLLTPKPGTDGFFVESVPQAGGARLNVWEVHSKGVREKCLAIVRALCFVVDCTEDSARIQRG